jgi:hypothetical protein
MSADLLQQIQQMQYNDRGAAEALLVRFIRDTFPLNVASVQLNPSAVSLNSFNGFLTLTDGKRLFFKTHTESDNIIGEYYRASVLADAGYPVIQPVYSSTEAGKHLLIYEVIESPSVFEVAWDIELGNADSLGGLTAAQNQADDDLLDLYKATLRSQKAADAAKEPIHQLFHHRLTKGRLERFYGPLPGQPLSDSIRVVLPDGETTMQAIRRTRWLVNGQAYTDTLDDIIGRAVRLLAPAQAGPSVIGHGDAHNGNVFFERDPQGSRLLYFDPAFAGRHHPLLDLTKPLFHNVFAMWMYYPQEKRDVTTIELVQNGSDWIVTHDYSLPPVRHMFLRSKLDRVLVPTLQLLQAEGVLREDWRDYLKCALFCCPFLTMNLADDKRFPPPITLLGLTMAVEMGAESHGERSLIDRALDEVSQQLDS